MKFDRTQHLIIVVVVFALGIASFLLSAGVFVVIGSDRFRDDLVARLLPVLLGPVPHTLLVMALAWGALLWCSSAKKLSTVFTGAVVLSLAFFPVTNFVHSRVEALLEVEGILALDSGYWVLFTIFGPLVAAGFFVLLRSAFRACHDVTRESLDRLLEESSLWLLVPSFLAAAFAVLIYAVNGQAAAVGIYLAICGSVFVAAIVASAVAGLRRIWRRKWFVRVRDGEVEGWKVVPGAEAPEELPGLPRLFDRLKNEDGVLLRLRPGVEKGAYRTGEAWEPWAVVEIYEP